MFQVEAAILEMILPVLEGPLSEDKFNLALWLHTSVTQRAMDHYAKKGKADCRSKCPWCCYQNVQVSTVEAFKVARSVSPGDIPRLEEWAEKIRPYNENLEVMEDRFRKGIPCVFLKNQRCSVYENRPTICRAFMAVDHRECKNAWDMRLQPDIPTVGFIEESQIDGVSMQLALDWAFYRKGIQVETYELAYAVSVAAQPGAFQRWLAGERIFDESRQWATPAPMKEIMGFMDNSIEIRGL
jgi:Fe-S-cluster containining protein